MTPIVYDLLLFKDPNHNLYLNHNLYPNLSLTK